jgi:hypothetical protein
LQLTGSPGIAASGGAQLTLTATIGMPAGAPTATPTPIPAGTVTFFIDGTPQAPVPTQVVDGTTMASLTVSGLSPGSHQVTATYGGNAQLTAAQTSQPLTVVVPDAPSGGPQLMGVQRLGSQGRRTVLELSFDVPLDPIRAQDVQNYRLVIARGRRVRIASAVLDTDGKTVTLRLARPLPVKSSAMLTVIGAAPGGLTDTHGEHLGASGQGVAGINATIAIAAIKPARNVPR